MALPNAGPNSCRWHWSYFIENFPRRSRPKSAHSTTASKKTVASKKPPGKDESSIEDMMKLDNLLDDRIQLANTISVLEDETEDSQYRSSVTEDILPEGNEDLSSGMFNRL